MPSILQVHSKVLHRILRLTRLIYLSWTVITLNPRLPLLRRIIPAHLRPKAVSGEGGVEISKGVQQPCRYWRR